MSSEEDFDELGEEDFDDDSSSLPPRLRAPVEAQKRKFKDAFQKRIPAPKSKEEESELEAEANSSVKDGEQAYKKLKGDDSG